MKTLNDLCGVCGHAIVLHRMYLKGGGIDFDRDARCPAGSNRDQPWGKVLAGDPLVTDGRVFVPNQMGGAT